MGSEEIALRLQDFWKAEGCPTISPHGSIPSGGLTPDVFFGVLAPEAWRSCQRVNVVDPSLAPYADDPLRPIADSCLQVTWQGSLSADDLRKRFTESLQILGLDLRARDVRFVPRNWDQPHLAVRAALWRVLIDRIDVGSFSYLHGLAGVDLKEVAMRAEYSLRRLVILVEGQDEDGPMDRGRQIASYALEASKPERIDALLDLYVEECEQALANGLYFPAYEHVLSSAYLHLLASLRDPSDSVERSEQAAHIARLAHGCASAYMEAANA